MTDVLSGLGPFAAKLRYRGQFHELAILTGLRVLSRLCLGDSFLRMEHLELRYKNFNPPIRRFFMGSARLSH